MAEMRFTPRHHGNAVLSKFPIISHHNMDVSLGGHERRGLLHCILRPPKLGRELHVICVHLGLRETHRREQVKELCRLVERKVPRDAPLIIAGDFNDWRLRAHKALSRMPGHRYLTIAWGGGTDVSAFNTAT